MKKETPSIVGQLLCCLIIVLIDRIGFSSAEFPRQRVLRMPWFKVDYDRRLATTPMARLYERACQLTHVRTGVKFQAAYRPKFRRLPACSVRIVANDKTGLLHKQVLGILKLFSRVRLTLVELAIDFRPGSGVRAHFIRRHGLFGRTRTISDHKFPNFSRFGSRRSRTSFRFYAKRSVGAFRTETELRRVWLAKHGIRTITDIPEIANFLVPAQIGFFELDKPRMIAAMTRAGIPVSRIVRTGKCRDLHRTLNFLRRRGVTNVRRLLKPLPVNHAIDSAVRRWAESWIDTDSMKGKTS